MLRRHDSRVAAGAEEATTAGISATPGRVRQARLLVDIQGQTLADWTAVSVCRQERHQRDAFLDGRALDRPLPRRSRYRVGLR